MRIPIILPLDSTMLNTANGALVRDDGTFGYNSSNGALSQTFVATDVVCVALDLGNSKIWFRKNGGLWMNTTDDPVTNTGGKALRILDTGIRLRLLKWCKYHCG